MEKGPIPAEYLTGKEKVPSPLPSKMLTCSAATTMSGFPSPLKSPNATAFGELPVKRPLAAWKVPSPLPISRLTSPLPIS
jgi:hypothetical protein